MTNGSGGRRQTFLLFSGRETRWGTPIAPIALRSGVHEEFTAVVSTLFKPAVNSVRSHSWEPKPFKLRHGVPWSRILAGNSSNVSLSPLTSRNPIGYAGFFFTSANCPWKDETTRSMKLTSDVVSLAAPVMIPRLMESCVPMPAECGNGSSSILKTKARRNRFVCLYRRVPTFPSSCRACWKNRRRNRLPRTLPFLTPAPFGAEICDSPDTLVIIPSYGY